jgi:tRNA(adenine34) deaminase
MSLSSEATDRAMMARCIELSAMAVKEGEYPFGSLIALDGRIIAEATNRTVRENDVSRHAEVIALSQAQQVVGRLELSRATLYSNVEPCAMCSYCIREAWVGRVVYALTSPIMGGASKWNILRDADISSRVPIFGPAPEVVSGVLAGKVQEAWRAWNPLAWEMVRMRGVLTAHEVPEEESLQVFARHRRSAWHYAISAFMRLSKKAKPVPVPAARQQGIEP